MKSCGQGRAGQGRAGQGRQTFQLGSVLDRHSRIFCCQCVQRVCVNITQRQQETMSWLSCVNTSRSLPVMAGAKSMNTRCKEVVRFELLASSIRLPVCNAGWGKRRKGGGGQSDVAGFSQMWRVECGKKNERCSQLWQRLMSACRQWYSRAMAANQQQWHRIRKIVDVSKPGSQQHRYEVLTTL